MINQTEDEEDVPPLEDMSEAINHLKLGKKKNRKHDAKINHYLEPSKNEFVARTESVVKILAKDNELIQKNQTKSESKTTINNMATAPTTRTSKKPAENYCGFTRGFLLSGNCNKTKPKQSTTKGNAVEKEFDVIKNNEEEQKTNIIPEVQDAMKSQIPLLNTTDWVTDDLLTKIMAHPKLSKQFMDPRFNEAIAKFQTNPKEVMTSCETNPELREFIQDFCSIMGDHFTSMAENQEKIKESSRNTTGNNINKDIGSYHSSYVSQEDEKEMQAILSDPKLTSILKSQDIQQLLFLLKNDPIKAQRVVNNADTSLRRKMQILIDAGLLQFGSG